MPQYHHEMFQAMTARFRRTYIESHEGVKWLARRACRNSARSPFPLEGCKKWKTSSSQVILCCSDNAGPKARNRYYPAKNAIKEVFHVQCTSHIR